MCEVADLLGAGRTDAAHATTVLLLAAAEQAALNDWHWPPAWLLTHLPDPPFARIGYHPVKDGARPISKLAGPALMAAAMAYLRDVAVLAEAARRRPGAAVDDDGNPTASRGAGRGKPKDAPTPKPQ